MAKEERKKLHSRALSALLCLTHVLPLACESKMTISSIFSTRYGYDSSWNFHKIWTLDGWNDHIIQPARDAVLDYYKVRTL